jgi:putative oxygen-independent coproporphyrinogen III oxidase
MNFCKTKVLNYLHNSEQVISYLTPKSAYIHIPFCRRRCFYCDFPVSVVGDKATGSTSGTIEQYVEVLCQEIAAIPVLGHSLETIFFGGGTPSLLAVEQLERILNQLQQQFGIVANAEISLEIDPGTFSKEQLQGYKNAGVNRVSLGVQAFQDELLLLCGRSHNSTDIFTSIQLISQVEIPEISFDLISGLPHQTLEQWQESLLKAVKIAPTHISCYDLIIEPVTAFGRQYAPGAKPLPTDENAAIMYKLAQQILTAAGYEHYEISNYAVPGHQCRHNRVYWENRPYYAFGMGAASNIEGFRFTRPRTRREYYAWVQQLVKQGGIMPSPKTPKTEVLLETLMLGLRLAEGLSLATLTQQFGAEILEQLWVAILPHYQQGWVEIMGNNQEIIDLKNAQKLPISGRFRLKDPEGFLFSNTVLADLFSQFS